MLMGVRQPRNYANMACNLCKLTGSYDTAYRLYLTMLGTFITDVVPEIIEGGAYAYDR